MVRGQGDEFSGGDRFGFARAQEGRQVHRDPVRDHQGGQTDDLGRRILAGHAYSLSQMRTTVENPPDHAGAGSARPHFQETAGRRPRMPVRPGGGNPWWPGPDSGSIRRRIPGSSRGSVRRPRCKTGCRPADRSGTGAGPRYASWTGSATAQWTVVTPCTGMKTPPRSRTSASTWGRSPPMTHSSGVFTISR